MDLGVEAALRLHVRVDALAQTGRGAPELLVKALAQALAGLNFMLRTATAVRLRNVLHESIADAAGDPAALECWAGVLQGPAPPPVPLPGSLCASAGIWGGALPFVASLEALGHGLAAVDRRFRHLLTQPACWRGHAITLLERHLSGAAIRGGAGWGKAFTILPALREARTIRVAGFVDSAFRARVLVPLRNACRALGGEAALLGCTFCEFHAGDRVELPSPRRLTAARHSGRQKGGGILIGNGPLSKADDGSRFFAIAIEELSTGERIDIGVTSSSPQEQFTDRSVDGGCAVVSGGLLTGAVGRMVPTPVGRAGCVRSHRHVNFAEDLLNSWIIESDGLLVGSHAGLRIRDSRWNARQLVVGDEVGMLVTARGELVISVNGETRASWRAQIPLDAPIYPVLDLFEGAPRVRILPNAMPQ